MNDENLSSKIFAGSLMTMSAKNLTVYCDNLSSWLVAGFSAAIALFLTNLDSLAAYVAIAGIRQAAKIVLASGLIAVAIKYCAFFVGAGCAAIPEAMDMGKEFAQDGIKINFEVVKSEIKRAFIWPGNILVAKGLKKAEFGDVNANIRLYLRIAQLITILTFLQTCLSLWAAGEIIGGIKS